MKHLFRKINPPICLLHILAFVILALPVNTISAAQETVPEKEYPTITQFEKNRQEFKEGKFKPLYSPSIYEDAQGPAERFNPIDNERFSMIETEMRYMIYARNKNQITNHLCAVGYILKSGEHEVVVVWHEAGLLISWWGGNVEKVNNLGFHYASAMFESFSIDLDHLVEDKTAPLGNGSITYRENAEGTIADCKKYGKQYVIEPFTPPPRDD